MKKYNYSLCYSVIILLCMIGSRYLFAGRPFMTSGASTVDQGLFELEIGSCFWSDDALVIGELKHGITEHAEIGFAVAYTIEPDPVERLSTIEIGCKFGLMPKLLAISACGEMGQTAYKIKGLLTRSIGPININAHFGYKATGIEDVAGALFYSADRVFRKSRFQLGVDISGDDEALQKWLIGGNYKIIDGLTIDLGMRGEFIDDPQYSAIVGLTGEF